MTRRGFLLLGTSGVAVAGASGTVYRAFATELEKAHGRLAGRSEVFQSRFGQMEYAVAGAGRPVLMLHGTGGGFDQGLAFARPLGEHGWQVIAPSRFGYLRTAFPEDPSPENQADALVELLDELKVERLPVIGGSAGALSALQFAIRHPTRCLSLVTVVPATYVPGRIPVRPGRIGQAIMTYGLQSDFLFWAAMKIAEDKMFSTLLATDPEVIHRARSNEQKRARDILAHILPVSARSRGLTNDGYQAGTPLAMPIETISIPTMAVSVEDDMFGTAAAARHIAATVPGAELIIFPTGGHIWIGHNEGMWAAIAAFLRRH